MAEQICRSLRDGATEGEHAPSLTIKDTRESPLGSHVFNYILSQLSSSVVAGRSQSKAVVLVCYAHSASFYVELLEKRGINVLGTPHWIQMLDCFSDPLGWKKHFSIEKPGDSQLGSGMIRTVTNVRDMEKLGSLILESGKGLVDQDKHRFSVGIDSVSDMLRHSSLLKVTRVLSNLRSNDKVSSVFWLLHSDLHDPKCSASLEYMSSMIAGVEPIALVTDGQRGNHENAYLMQNIAERKLNVLLKCRNGRIRIMNEEFHVTQSGLKFVSVPSRPDTVDQLLPKVHFNLQLSDKERLERDNVVLPFEHQGNGKPIQIYDGRRSLLEANLSNSCDGEHAEGKIIYFRDSDDEMPDSDEDPDDDLDI